MPRGRGGARAGTPGKAYGNRSDLNKPKVVPIAAASGQPYGARVAQEDAQRALPVAAPPVPVGDVGSPQQGVEAPSQAAGMLSGPTRRPDEPLTAGMPFGPGPGPEAMLPSPPSTVAELVNQLADGPFASTEAQVLRSFLQSGQ